MAVFSELFALVEKQALDGGLSRREIAFRLMKVAHAIRQVTEATQKLCCLDWRRANTSFWPEWGGVTSDLSRASEYLQSVFDGAERSCPSYDEVSRLLFALRPSPVSRMQVFRLLTDQRDGGTLQDDTLVSAQEFLWAITEIEHARPLLTAVADTLQSKARQYACGSSE